MAPPSKRQKFLNLCDKRIISLKIEEVTWYEAAAFCQSFGAHLVEINDKAELAFIDTAAQQVSWVDGPWIGMLRPFGDEFWILPSIRTETQDVDLNKMFGEIAKDSSHDCGGYNRRGKDFGFWRCRRGGSPWCELELATDQQNK
ncbi:uncharacterized protein LOC129583305 isoform X2 [Paramacrobiotus metropolitanus]|uniref:uncharacterized protein LOC129583305 isoform X2 n=1 Tax=Paramacrobiotus metropolitanus TaxID=2943436 RepID=UPI00244599DB|nr:uncharacterized protein LOC129583305 isoform X2 [Paramacrobiotus metropolitanus]